MEEEKLLRVIQRLDDLNKQYRKNRGDRKLHILFELVQLSEIINKLEREAELLLLWNLCE